MDKKSLVILRLAIYVALGAWLIAYVLNHPVSFGSAGTLYFAGKKFHAEKKYQQAEETFKRVIRMQPGMGKAYLMLGVVYLDQDRPLDAEREFKRALDNDLDGINRMITYNNLGSTYLENLHDPDRAVEAFSRSTEVLPGFIDPEVDPYLGLVRAYLAKADFERAIRMAQESIRTHPASGLGLRNLGTAYLAKGDFAGARNTYKELKAVNEHMAKGLLLAIESAESVEKKKQDFLDKFSASLDTTDNAALLYTDAVFKLKDLAPAEFAAAAKNITEKVFSSGWQEKNDDLLVLIEKNRPAMDQFRKASGLAVCDFSYDRPGNGSRYAAGFFLPPRMIELVRLVLLDAKLKERQLDLDGAVLDYISVLRFTGHIEAQEGTGILRVLIKSIIEQPVFLAIKGFISRPDAGAVRVRQLLQELVSLSAGRESIGSLFREDIRNSNAEVFSEAAMRQMRKSWGEKRTAELFAEYTRLMDKAEQILIEGVEKDSIEDAKRQIDRLTSDVLGKRSKFLLIAQMAKMLVFRQPNPEPEYIAKTWVALAMPPYFSAVDRLKEARLKEDIFSADLARRLNELEQEGKP